eukprot:gene24281-biopygen13434
MGHIFNAHPKSLKSFPPCCVANVSSAVPSSFSRVGSGYCRASTCSSCDHDYTRVRSDSLLAAAADFCRLCPNSLAKSLFVAAGEFSRGGYSELWCTICFLRANKVSTDASPGAGIAAALPSRPCRATISKVAVPQDRVVALSTAGVAVLCMVQFQVQKKLRAEQPNFSQPSFGTEVNYIFGQAQPGAPFFSLAAVQQQASCKTTHAGRQRYPLLRQ